jgi:hypothetical protein
MVAIKVCVTSNPGPFIATCTKLLVKSAPSVSSAMDRATCTITKPLRGFHLVTDSDGSACLIAKLRSAFELRSAGSREENRSITKAVRVAYRKRPRSFWK